MRKHVEWHDAGFDTELQPVMPLKKLLARKVGDQWVAITGPMAERFSTLHDCVCWDAMGAGVGLLGRAFPAIDIDVEDFELAAAISSLVLDTLGEGPMRTRGNSAKRLHLFRTGDVMRKRRIAWGDRQAVELLATGQFYVADGLHPSGVAYTWDEHPCDVTMAGLQLIQPIDVDMFFVALEALLRERGIEPTSVSSGASAIGDRLPLDALSLRAPSPDHVLKVLNQWQNNLSYDDAFRAIVAVKAALGPDREDYWPEVLGWLMTYGGNTEEWCRSRWDSVHNAEVGWDWLASKVPLLSAQFDFDGDTTSTTAPAVDDPEEKAFAAARAKYVYVENQSKFYEPGVGRFLDFTKFDAANTNLAPFGSKNAAHKLAINDKQFPRVRDVTYRPGGDLTVMEDHNGVPTLCINTYRPSHLVPVTDVTDGEVKPWTDHVRLLLTEEDAEHFLDYCAFTLQQPGEKINHCPVIISETQGMGKDTMLIPLRRGIGEHNWADIEPDRISESFNESWIRKKIWYVSEIMTFHRKETMNRLKPLIVNHPPMVTVSQKYVDSYTIPNIGNMIMTSNHLDALALEEGQRRYWIARCKIETPPNEDYFNALHGWLDNGGDAKAVGWLLKRDVSRFDHKGRAPVNEATRDVIESFVPPPVRWLREQFAEGGAFHNASRVTVDEIRARYDDGFSSNDLKPHVVTSHLRKLGYKHSSKKFRIDGATVAHIWSRTGDEESADLYRAERKTRGAA